MISPDSTVLVDVDVTDNEPLMTLLMNNSIKTTMMQMQMLMLIMSHSYYLHADADDEQFHYDDADADVDADADDVPLILLDMFII